MQVSRRVRSGLTQQRRCAENKRFLARFEKEREVGFVMLRVGARHSSRDFSLALGAYELTACLPQ